MCKRLEYGGDRIAPRVLQVEDTAHGKGKAEQNARKGVKIHKLGMKPTKKCVLQLMRCGWGIERDGMCTYHLRAQLWPVDRALAAVRGALDADLVRLLIDLGAHHAGGRGLNLTPSECGQDGETTSVVSDMQLVQERK